MTFKRKTDSFSGEVLVKFAVPDSSKGNEKKEATELAVQQFLDYVRDSLDLVFTGNETASSHMFISISEDDLESMLSLDGLDDYVASIEIV